MENGDLARRAAAFFDLARQHPRGRRLIDSIRWTQIIKFIVDNKAEFCLDVKRGHLAVLPGDAPAKDVETEFYEVSRVYVDGEALSDLLEGKKDSVDVQYADEALKVLPGGKYYVVSLVHQLFRFGRQELVEGKVT